MTTKPEFVYVTYIATSPEKLWQALVDPAVTGKYWAGRKEDGPPHVNVSDWEPGSRWEHQRLDDARTVDLVGTVLESEPPRRLVLTWARPRDAEDDGKHSRVTFDVEPLDAGFLRLTVTHENLGHDPDMLAGISRGWPMVLSNLKTLLETGAALPGSAGAS